MLHDSLDKAAIKGAKALLNSLSKPIGSLGELENYAERLAGIRGFVGGGFNNKRVVVFAADNGVYAQGITPVPQCVTLIQAANIARGVAGVNVLANMAGADVKIYNVGIMGRAEDSGIIGEPVVAGTNDIFYRPAMDKKQLEAALNAGARAVLGADLLGVGEMGICNTTTAAAVTSCLLNAPPETVTGRGAGITDEQLAKKIEVVKHAIAVNKPNSSDALDVLKKVGGLDIAAMAGAFLECERQRLPVVIDGFISAAAALCAYRVSPSVKNFMFASHASTEPGYALIMDNMGLKPPLHLNMRLGEGSGCPLMFLLLEASLRITDEMATLNGSGIDASGFVDIT